MRTSPFIVSVFVAANALAQPIPQVVVFVCEHGAAKSVVAAAHFNKLAAERRVPFRAVARGTAPDRKVPDRIADGLEGEGLTMPPAYVPALVTASDVDGAARVVTFDVTLSVATEGVRVHRWDGLPAFSDGYGPASAAISTKVDALLRELERGAEKQ